LEADDNRGNEVVAMIAKQVSNDNKSFKLLLYYIFLEDIKYMIILTRQERERLNYNLTIRPRLIARYLRWQEYLHVT
jgi:hypothetical protein